MPLWGLVMHTAEAPTRTPALQDILPCDAGPFLYPINGVSTGHAAMHFDHLSVGAIHHGHKQKWLHLMPLSEFHPDRNDIPPSHFGQEGILGWGREGMSPS